MWMRTLVSTAALAAACTAQRGVPTAADSAAADVDDHQPSEIAVRVAASQPTVGPSESVRIVVTVTNTDSERHAIEASSGCFTDYQLLDEDGTVVGTSLQMCPAVMSRRVLAPGESFSETHVWKRGLRGMPELPAGTYRLRGVLLDRTSPVTSTAVDVVVTPDG